MKAILTYGIFTAEVSMKEPLRQVVLMKPKVIDVSGKYNPADEITKSDKLLFELQETPKTGTPLKYMFIGEI